MKKVFVCALAVVVGMMFFQVPGARADFPNRMVTCVVGFSPGGMTDVVSRLLADKMGEFLGQKVIVENQPGAGGATALLRTLDGPTDGYTFVSMSTSTAAGTALVGKPVDIEKIGFIGAYMPQERVLFARKDAPFTTFEGLVEYAKKSPVTFAGGGSIWAANVVEAMAKEMDLNIRVVPFRSGGDGAAAILGGHVTLAETGVGTPAWQSAIKGGLNVIAVLGDGDLKDLGFPEIKSIRDYGATHFVRQYFGFAMSAGVPEYRRQKIEDAFEYAINHADVIKRMEELDLQPRYISSEEYRPIIEAVLKEVPALVEYLKD